VSRLLILCTVRRLFQGYLRLSHLDGYSVQTAKLVIVLGRKRRMSTRSSELPVSFCVSCLSCMACCCWCDGVVVARLYLVVLACCVLVRAECCASVFMFVQIVGMSMQGDDVVWHCVVYPVLFVGLSSSLGGCVRVAFWCLSCISVERSCSRVYLAKSSSAWGSGSVIV